MPPKDAAAKAAKAKVNNAVEQHADLDLKKLAEAIAKFKCPVEPLAPFLKKIKNEMQLIKDGQQTEPPTFPFFAYEKMGFDTCKAIMGALPTYPWLRQLSLVHCYIGDDGVMVVCDFIKQYLPPPESNPFGVEVLELTENDIGPRGAGYLGKLLTQNESLKTVVLDFNPLGDDGAGLLGDGMKWNSTLQTLSMQYCGIGPEGGEMVAKYIVRSSSVKDLSLRGNPLGPHGVAQIGRSLAKNAYLVKLDLADTSFGIDLETIEIIRDGIEGNDSLESIDLNLNSLVPAGMQLLLEVLKQKPKITQFLVYERISDVVFREVLDTVAANIKMMKKRRKKAKTAKKQDPSAAAGDTTAIDSGRVQSAAPASPS